MSLMRLLNIEDKVTYTALSFLEITVFFFVSAVAFRGLYELAVTVGLPVWAWILAGGAYLLIVTIYWAPGKKVQDEAELRAFVLFLVAALVVGAIVLELRYQGLSAAFRTFKGILTSGSQDLAK